MPKSDLIKLECEYCGNHTIIDIRDPAEKVLPVVALWRGVMDGDNPSGQVADNHRWYDTLDCMIAGERNAASKKAQAAQKQAELNATLDRANAALKKSPFMVKKDEIEAVPI